MNILFLSSWYPNKITPTNGDFVQRHAQAVALIHEVIALHVIFDVNLQSFKKIDISEKQQVTEYIVYFSLPKFLIFLKPFLFIWFYISSFQIIRKKYGKPDIVHANILYPIGIIAVIYKFLFRVPYVCSEHWCAFLIDANIYLPRITMCAIRYIARKALCIMPVSEYLQHSMQEKKIVGNYAVINNVVETEIFTPNENVNKPIHKILHISTLKNGHKNIRGILRTIKNISEIRQDFVLEIISENSGDELLAYAKELRIEKFITFH